MVDNKIRVKEVRMKINIQMPSSCSGCDYEVMVGNQDEEGRLECLFTEEVITKSKSIECRGNKCPLVIDNKLIAKELNKKDWELIKNALMGHSVTMTSNCLECKDVMPKESYNRDMDESKRLVYLVNVLEGRKEYLSR